MVIRAMLEVANRVAKASRGMQKNSKLKRICIEAKRRAHCAQKLWEEVDQVSYFIILEMLFHFC